MRSKITSLLVAVASTLTLNACTVGPDYRRPEIQTAAQWPTDRPGSPAQQAGDRWWKLYGDATLNTLIDEALSNNLDLRLAIERVNEAQAQTRFTKTDNAPNINARAGVNRSQFSEIGAQPMPPGTPREQNSYDVRVQASYELDFFGKYRRANEAARAELLASEAAQHTVRLSLTKQVAQQYFALLAAEGQMKVLERTLAARQETLELDSQRFGAGVTSEFNLLQSQAEVLAAQAQLAQAVQTREQQEATLLLLLGRPPRELLQANVSRGTPTKSDIVWIPDGLPSDLLLRRPDIQEAEQKLVAANARIGNVRSTIFPSIALTGYLGSESVQMTDLFSGPAGIYQIAATLTQPLWQGGRRREALHVAESRHEQALLTYQKTVADAFIDVRRALSSQHGARLVWQAESQRVDTLTQAYEQVLSRLKGGVSSRLEALDTERQLLQAQLSQIDAERAQRAAVADLFTALGGGWDSAATTNP